MPETLELMDRLRDHEYAAVVSGAGPSLLVLTRRHPEDRADDPAGRRVREVTALTPTGWTVLPLEVDRSGARFLTNRPSVSSR